MDKWLHHTVLCGCNYFSMPWSTCWLRVNDMQLIPVGKLAENLYTSPGNQYQGLLSLTSFPSQLKFDEHCNSIPYDITAKFCTCHDSSAVLSCAKFCSDYFNRIWMRTKWNIRKILIVMEKIVSKMVPWHSLLYWSERISIYHYMLPTMLRFPVQNIDYW